MDFDKFIFMRVLIASDNVYRYDICIRKDHVLECLFSTQCEFQANIMKSLIAIQEQAHYALINALMDIKDPIIKKQCEGVVANINHLEKYITDGGEE